MSALSDILDDIGPVVGQAIIEAALHTTIKNAISGNIAAIKAATQAAPFAPANILGVQWRLYIASDDAKAVVITIPATGYVLRHEIP